MCELISRRDRETVAKGVGAGPPAVVDVRPPPPFRSPAPVLSPRIAFDAGNYIATKAYDVSERTGWLEEFGGTNTAGNDDAFRACNTGIHASQYRGESNAQ